MFNISFTYVKKTSYLSLKGLWKDLLTLAPPTSYHDLHSSKLFGLKVKLQPHYISPSPSSTVQLQWPSDSSRTLGALSWPQAFWTILFIPTTSRQSRVPDGVSLRVLCPERPTIWCSPQHCSQGGNWLLSVWRRRHTQPFLLLIETVS